MRLTCPNCGAQYAVDTRVIPETGRDVQCSNCGKTWFQHHPDHAPDQQPEPETPVVEPEIAAPPPPPPSSPPSEPEPAPEPAIEPPAAAAGEVEDESPDPALGLAAGDFDDGAEDEAIEELAELPRQPVPHFDTTAPDGVLEPEPEPEPEPIPARRPVDEAALEVLREEAAREQAARMAERGTLESQGELDMPAPDSTARRAEQDLAPRAPARVVPSDTIPVDEDERSDTPAPRRDRLPDVEEINSTLRPEEVAAAQKAEDRVPVERRNRGRRIGLGIAFFLFGGLALLYSQHQTISEKLPQAAPVLEQYVSSIDATRLRLDAALRAAVTRIQGSSE